MRAKYITSMHLYLLVSSNLRVEFKRLENHKNVLSNGTDAEMQFSLGNKRKNPIQVEKSTL